MTAPTFRPDPDADNAAAAWLARIDRGLSPREQDEFFLWLAAHPQHGDLFAEHRATMRHLQLLAQWRPEHGAQPNPDLLAPTRATSRTHPWRRGPILWLAAASLVVGISGFSLWPASHAPAPASVTSEAQSARRMLLNDGSTIDLGTGARVEVLYRATERRIRLRAGAAHFVVAHNPQRPFVVETDRAAVRALGTAFDVHLQPGAVEVLVTDGTVSVSALTQSSATPSHAHSDESRSAVAKAGNRVTVGTLAGETRAPELSPLQPEDRRRMVASLTAGPRQLEFADAPLASIVAELNRDNRVRILIADPILAALPVGAALHSDNVEGFLRLLERSFKVVVERPDETTIVLRRRP